MAAVTVNGLIAGMTPAQFEALPPHKKLLHSTKMPNEFLLNNAILSRKQARRLGLATGGASRIFQPVHARTLRPSLVAKRPLNSWMAYRSYYSSIFASLQQKNASTHLTILWAEDPFKAKWAVLARAYSAIRDQVGKSSAPLDRFLALVCPEIGMIATDEYLEKMCWMWEAGVDGVMKLRQVSVPDIASFANHIQHTLMTEKDVVHFCARNFYISRSNAITIAGQPGAAQHGLLATAPIAPVAAVAPIAPIAPPATNNSFLLQTIANPHLAASDVLGFDISAFMGPAEQSEAPKLPSPPPPAPYQWTGCLADIYNPGEGTFDFDALANNRGTSPYDVGDISDPRSFDEMFGEVVQDGFLQPSVPENEDYRF